MKLLPSLLSWMLKSRVSASSFSPPALACFTTKRVTGRTAPRSTCRNKGPSLAHHRSASPPATLPFTAFSGPCSGLHGAASRGGAIEREVQLAIRPVDLELVDPGHRLAAVGRTCDIQADEAGLDRRLDHMRRRPRVRGALPDAARPRRRTLPGRLAQPLRDGRRRSRPAGRCPSGPGQSRRAGPAARSGTWPRVRARRRSPRAAAPARRPRASAWRRRRAGARSSRSSTPAWRGGQTAAVSRLTADQVLVEGVDVLVGRHHTLDPVAVAARSARAPGRTVRGLASSPACRADRRAA